LQSGDPERNRIERSSEGTAYWIAIGVFVSVTAILPIVGLRNWSQLPR